MVQSISADLQRLIFTFLGGPEDSRIPKDYLVACTSVCKRWKEASEEKLWERIRKQKLYTFTPVPGCGSLKKQCLERLKGIGERLLARKYEERAFRVQNPSSSTHNAHIQTIRWKDKMLIPFGHEMALYPVRREQAGALPPEAVFSYPGMFNRAFFVRGDKLIGMCQRGVDVNVLVWDLSTKEQTHNLAHRFSFGSENPMPLVDSRGEKFGYIECNKFYTLDLFGVRSEFTFDQAISAVWVAPDNRLFVAFHSPSAHPVIEERNLVTMQTERRLTIAGFNLGGYITQLWLFQERLFAVALLDSHLLEIDLKSEPASFYPIPFATQIDQEGGVPENRESILVRHHWSQFGPYALEWGVRLFRVYNLDTRSHVASYPREFVSVGGCHFAHGEWSEVGSKMQGLSSTRCEYHDFNPPLPIPPEESSCWSRFLNALDWFLNWLISLFKGA